jgi:hypothetical protein
MWRIRIARSVGCSMRFGAIGVTVSQIKEYLGHDGETLKAKELEDLRGIYVAIKDGETNWREVMDHLAATRKPQPVPQPAAATNDGKPAAESSLKDKLRDRAAKPNSVGQLRHGANEPTTPIATVPDDGAAEEWLRLSALHWPEGWKSDVRVYARRHLQGRTYDSAPRAIVLLQRELRFLGAQNVVLSSNIPLRRDGLPYADFRRPDDPGVAVYFLYRKRQMCFACDRYYMTEDNVRAIALTIEALRGIERWGASDMIERAFTGFQAIAEKAQRSWREVFGFKPGEVVILPDGLEAMFSASSHMNVIPITAAAMPQ